MELVRSLACHADAITTVVILSDDNHIITASADKSIKIWDLELQKLLSTQELSHKNAIVKIFLTSHEQQLISVSSDGCVKLWNIKDKQYINLCATLLTEGAYHYIEYNTVKEIIITASKQGNYSIWRLKDDSLIFEKENALKTGIGSLCLTNDGEYIIAPHISEPVVSIQSISKQENVAILPYNSNTEQEPDLPKKKKDSAISVSAVGPSSDGSILAVAYSNGVILIWSMINFNTIFQINDQGKWYGLSMHFQSPQKLIIAGSDRSIRIYDMEANEFLNKLERIHKESICGITGRFDSDIFITFSKDCSFRAWSIKKNIKIADFDNPHDRNVNTVVFNKQGNLFYSGSSDMTIKTWTLHGCNLVHTLKTTHTNPITAIALSSNEQYIACSSADKSIKIWNVQNYQSIYTWKNAHTQIINSLAIAKDNERMISASSDNTIKVWSISTKKILHIFEEAHLHDVTALILTPNGRFAISGSSSKSIKIWSLDDYKLVHTFDNANIYMTNALTVTNDSIRLISASFDRSIRVWDLEVYQCISEIQNAHSDSINALALVDKFNVLLSGSTDRNIKFWNLNTNELLYNLENAHLYLIKCLAVSPDNNFLVSVSADKSIKLWNISVLEILLKGKYKSESQMGMVRVRSSDSLDERQYTRYSRIKETFALQSSIIEKISNENKSKNYYFAFTLKRIAAMASSMANSDYARADEHRGEIEDSQKLLMTHSESFIKEIENLIDHEISLMTPLSEFIDTNSSHLLKHKQEEVDKVSSPVKHLQRIKFNENLQVIEKHCNLFAHRLKSFASRPDKDYEFLNESRVVLFEQFSSLSKEIDKLIIEGSNSILSSKGGDSRNLKEGDGKVNALITAVRHAIAKFLSTLKLLTENEQEFERVNNKVVEYYEQACSAKAKIHSLEKDLLYSEEEIHTLKELQLVKILQKIDMKTVNETKKLHDLEESHKVLLRQMLQENQALKDLRKRQSYLYSVFSQDELFLIKVVSNFIENKQLQIKELLDSIRNIDLRNLTECCNNLIKQLNALSAEFNHKIKKEGTSDVSPVQDMM